ncbi:GvpL/GvpF family gas vesicle protein [Streptomyces filamentosus]|uniref:GvpL/GvpF family gas vesicle protein n=1 Tax=Streptomyces filamentosus TaxID=67294 RepID=UPI0033DB47FF
MALYVYAITGASHPLRLDGLTGVGDGRTPLRPVREGELRAVVSEAPEEIGLTRPDLEAHQAVQERLWDDGTTLPLGFGFVAQDEDAVRAVLAESAEQFAARLDELTGRAEFSVKGIQEEEAALREVVDEVEEVRRLNEVTRDGGGTYDDRLELGRLLLDEVQARQVGLAEAVLAALRPHAQAERLSEPSQEYFLSASFLVDRERAEDFVRAAEEAAGDLSDGVEIRVRGPLPPYSFV